MKKVIFIYWAQKFINAPIVVKKCLLSWKLKNPTWEIIELNDDNLSEYINIEEEIPDIQKKNITKTSYSDIIRIFLLAKHGGCWCDATTFCNQSLDIWLNKNTLTGFFGFDKPGIDRLLSTWFLYSEENNYIIQKWKEKTILYWKNHNKMHHYFWFHYLFGDLYNSDNKFKELWDSTPKISADGPQYIQKQGLLNKLSDKVTNHINEIKTPLYKLSYKYNMKKYNEECNLSYLLKLFTIASYKVSTNNLGDHIQIIANLNLLKKYGLTPQVYIDRDNEIKKLNKQSNCFKKIYLIMNGWHRRNNEQWPPNAKICPLFIAFHIRLKACPYILNKNSLEYFKNNEPIGCRDPFTNNLLNKNGIKSFETNCLTLTLNKINTPYTGKIYVSSRDREIEKYIPNHIKYDYINHYSNTSNFEQNMELAKKLLIKYSGAKLVITTFLHCALPCIGMGIPVICFYPNSSKNINESDKERLSGLKKIIDIQTFKDVHKVDWNPKCVDISNFKNELIKIYHENLVHCLTK